MAKILVVEDGTAIADLIGGESRARGWSVDITDNGPTAVELAVTGRYRLAILDLENRTDGLSVLAAVRTAAPAQKVMVLCDITDPGRGIQALEQGACDYLARPFSLDELMARISTRLQTSSPGVPVWCLEGAGFVLDLARRKVDTGRGVIRLTQRECVLLAHFMRHPGQVLSRQELLGAVWGDAQDPGSNVVDTCVRRLRTKLGDDVIDTVRNVGYALRSA